MDTSTVLQVQAFIDTDGVDLKTWTAVGVGDTQGLTAVGASFQEARRSFAEIVALAVANDVLTTDVVPSSIRVITSTRKTFSLDELLETS